MNCEKINRGFNDIGEALFAKWILTYMYYIIQTFNINTCIYISIIWMHIFYNKIKKQFKIATYELSQGRTE